MQTKQFGQTIENLVAEFLILQRLTLVAKNYSCRLGEIDLVMLDASDNTVVFVEVRFRSSAFHGNATETVHWKKQRKLKRTALHFLQKHSDSKQRARIDVIGVSSIYEDNVGNSPNNIQSSEMPFVHDVSLHQFEQYQLVWTRNAVTD